MSDFETAQQLFFEGLQLLEANNLHAAEARFARSLEIVPARLSTLNNLSAVKIKLSKFAEAEELARRAVKLESKSPEAWSNLGLALTARGRPDEALLACDRAIEGNASYPMGWLAKAVTLRELKTYDQALVACGRALKLDPNKYEILYEKSLILKELDRVEEAQELYRKALDIRIASSPVFIGERCLTQTAEALIINRNPEMDFSFKSFEDLSRFCPNFPGQLADHLHYDFHFNYVFIGDATRPSARKQIPRPHFVINNHTNGELVVSEGDLGRLKDLVESFGVPVVNHPAKAVATIRDLSAKLLDGTSGIRVPKTLRFSCFRESPASNSPAGDLQPGPGVLPSQWGGFDSGPAKVGYDFQAKTCDELVREIENQFDYPLITRTLSSQEGRGMNKVDSRNALVEMLSAPDRPEKFFVTEFVDSRGTNKFFRKIRAAIVKDEIVIVRVDYDSIWKIYARRSDERVAFYLNNAYLLDEEKRICQDPEAGLGRSAITSLRVIRDRIPLDIFGIDFDVDADGRLVFYEANATMNLFSTARQEVPYPKEPQEHLKQAFRRYFKSLFDVSRRLPDDLPDRRKTSAF